MRFNFFAIQIVMLCIVVFLIQVIVPGFTEWILLDASKPLEAWRFVTSIFAHGDLAHIVYNMFALLLFGSLLEWLIGGKRFIFVFFVTGILANFVAVNFYDLSLGASGAIFGVIGALVIVRPLLIVWAFGLPMPMFVAGILWAIGSIVGLFTPSDVGDIAHLAGMVFGLLLGLVFRDWTNNKGGNSSRVRFDEDSLRRWEDHYLRR